MAWRMLDVWHHAWNRLAEPRHDWFVRVWDDSAVWVEGMRRELAGSEMMPCCSSDRAVAISQPPTIGEQFRGGDLPYVHGGAALVLSREAMRRFMNGDAGSSTNGTALHRDWALRRCSQRHVNPVMCKHAEDILVGFALLRSGVRFRYSTGISAHSTLSRHGDRLNGDAVVACEIPIAGQYSRTGEIAGVWSVHYVDAARQADWVAAMQSACLPGLASEAQEVFDALRAEAPMVTPSDFIGADEASPESEDKARPGKAAVSSAAELPSPGTLQGAAAPESVHKMEFRAWHMMCKRASLGGVAVDANSSARRARLAPLAWAPALERPASHKPPKAAANLRMKTIAALAALAISLGSRVRNFADSEFGCAYVSVTALVALPTPAPALASLPRKPRPFTVQVQAQTLPTAPCFIYDDDKIEAPCSVSVKNTSSYSIRLYGADAEPEFWSTAAVNGSWADAQGRGFNKNFLYITGANKEGVKIPMTHPVLARHNDSTPTQWQVSFFVPSAFSRNETSVPTPTDKDVTIQRAPLFKVAFKEFPGFATEKDFLSCEADLRAALAADGVATLGGTDWSRVWAQYDSPFTLFGRHNECWVRVQ
ncbi:unnamed protein product [Symbiodinium sp. KB8]|nr:unnamed protein product [Symbiodinium sp. KB8]